MRHPEQPPRERRRFPQPWQVLPCFAEDLLGQILGLVTPPGFAVHVSDQRRAVSLNQRHEGVGITLGRQLDRFRVGQFHVLPLFLQR